MSKKDSSLTHMTPVRRELLTPSEFRSLVKESPDLIARSRFIAPTIGQRNFGGFDVQYTIPRLKRMQSA